ILDGGEKITSGELYAAYAKKLPKCGKQLTERRIRDFLNNLEKQGLIEMNLVDLGNKGKTRELKSRIARQIAMRELG
ncbi:hypothetical protein KJ891_04705, partial [Candidatus Micrarchaeota archaeon]|nr:hypothetical protein [Candidatus Micrarchaeota archaeon]